MLIANELIAEARLATGLNSLGDDSFRPFMEKVLDSVNKESRFSEIGAMAFRAMVMKALTNRLEVEDWYKRHPEIDEEEIVAPVFGVGFPRTGSSLLSSLMARDPETRYLSTWESPTSCPPPVKGDMNDPRIAEAQARIDLFKERYPNLFAMVPMGVHEPTECHEILMSAFCTDYYYQYSMCPGFMAWIHDDARDYEQGYRYHKRVLKLLQWRYPPKRWSLKMPGHNLMMEGLFKVYPDARFIYTHREPEKVLPSVVKLVAEIREDFLEDPRTDLFAKTQIDIWEKNMSRLESFRRKHEDLFIDIYHRDLLSNPQAEIERLYKWLGWELKPSYVKAMNDWRAANPKTAYKTRTGPFQLDMDEVKQRLKFYNDRYFAGR
jgi:hypothetical protein